MQQIYKGIAFIRFFITILLIIVLLLAVSALFAQEANSTISSKIKGLRENGIYSTKDRNVGYDIKLNNTITDNQKGTIVLSIKNLFGQAIYTEEIPLFIAPKGVFYKDLKIDASKFIPGFYYTQMVIKTNHFNQNFNYVIAVEPEKISSTSSTPFDFNTFWNEAKNDLANINPLYKITRRGDVSTSTNDVFLIEYISLGNVPIRGWLSIPKGRRKYPVIYKLANYATDNFIDNQSNMATLSIDVRGIGISADMGKIVYDNYITAGLTNRNKYIYRAVYMDCLRGLDFLYKNASLMIDTSKIIVKGEGQGAAIAAIIASFDNRVKGIIMEKPTLVDMRTVFTVAEQRNQKMWPVNAVKSFLSDKKISTDDFFKTWDYFDPLSFATQIKCPVLVGLSLKHSTSLPQPTYNFYNQLINKKRELYCVADNENGMNDAYYRFENYWIKEILRLPN